MDRSRIWQIIDESKAASDGDLSEHAERVTQILASLPPEQIIAFEQGLLQLQSESYRQDLWAAAYIINGGCSDDGFDYFRSWLIAQGRETYEKAVQDPSTLITVIDSLGHEDADFEEFLYVAHEAYRRAVGEDMPDVKRPAFELVGEDWDEESVDELFPELAKKANARFG